MIRLFSSAAYDTFLSIKDVFVCVQLRVGNYIFLINGVRLRQGVPMTPRPKNPKLNIKKNELKDQYVDYLFNYTSLILCFTEEHNGKLCSKGEKIGLFTTSVM